VQHVRVCQDDMPPFANRLTRIVRSIAVVGEDSETVVQPFGEILQLSQLILSQRFRRKQVQGASVGILQHRVQNRQVVAERLARSRRRNHNYVLAIMYQVGGGRLVRLQVADSFILIGLSQGTCNPGRHGAKLGLSGRNLPYRGEHLFLAVMRDQRTENVVNGFETGWQARC